MARTPAATRTTCCKSRSENTRPSSSSVLTRFSRLLSYLNNDGTVGGDQLSVSALPQTPEGSEAPSVHSQQIQEVQPALLGHAGASLEASAAPVGPSDRQPPGSGRDTGPSGATVGGTDVTEQKLQITMINYSDFSYC